MTIYVSSDPRIERQRGIVTHTYEEYDVPYMQEIHPGLWQGGVTPGLVLPDHITDVVTLFPEHHYITYQRLKSFLSWEIEDDGSDPDTEMIDAIATWVNCRIQLGGEVLVHCQAGLNRSSLIIAWSLILAGEFDTAESVIDYIRHKRSPACFSNPAYIRWLKEMTQ